MKKKCKRAEAAQALCTRLAAHHAKVELAISTLETMRQEAEHAIAMQQPAHDEAAKTLDALVATTMATLMRQRFSEVLLQQLRPSVVESTGPGLSESGSTPEK